MLSLFVVAALVVALLPLVAGAAAAACPPSGGVTIPPATPPEGDFRIAGRGWGHGAGMSQYGARGAAELGCDATTILKTYFPGTSVETTKLPPNIRVSLLQSAANLQVQAVAGPIPWEVCTDASCTELPIRQAQDELWTVRLDSSGAYVVTGSKGEVWKGGDRYALLRARLSQNSSDDRIVRLPDTGRRYKWGLLELDSVAPSDRDPYMFVTLDIAPFDRYLHGLGEVPSSWPMEALKAQVIAARSYALLRREAFGGNRAGCRCDVYATVRDQAYIGYDKEAEGTDAVYGKRWVSAVAATRSDDLSSAATLRYEGKTADAYYSSSHGGYSESSAFVFSAAVPYLKPVDDTRWEQAAKNPNLTWGVAKSAAEVGNAFGVGLATDVDLPDPKGHGERIGDPAKGYGGVVITGATGTKTVSGNQFRQALGLRSTLLTVSGGPPLPPASPTPTPSPSPTLSPSPTPDPSPQPEPVERVAGSDRVGTAVAVSQEYWSSAAQGLLATATDFPDALAAAALAAKLDTPLLLTPPDTLPEAVLDEFRRLKVGTVRILGGESAVSAGVEQRLRQAGFTTERLAGSNRFATARAVALAAGAADTREVALVLGEDWPDAVSAGALAATPQRLPALLTARDRLPQITEQALRELGTVKVFLVGGTGSIAVEVEQRLRELGYETQRLAGVNRYDTSAQVAEEALRRLGGTRTVVAASGNGFPDALAAGALAAQRSGILVLVPRDDLGHAPSTRQLLRDRAETLDAGIVVGGTAAVSEQVRKQIGEAISG